MNLNDYFDPVSLDKPNHQVLPESITFSRFLEIHTPDNPVRNVGKFDIALVGVPEDKNAPIPGTAKAPDLIRSKLYQLGSINRKLKIIDLGNIRITKNINDSYYALRDITIELRKNNVLVVYLGGSQDLTFGICLAFEKLHKSFTLGTIDSRVDFGLRDKKVTPYGYLDHILKGKKASSFNYFNIGHQSYLTHTKILDQLERKGYECLRLGAARNDLLMVEPYLRDAGFISIDMCAIRQSEAPGVTSPSPNGFFAHEICQLARYAGTAYGIEGLGIFGLFPDNDLNCQTSHLAAQVIWYFMEGFSLRLHENGDTPGNHKYHVNLQEQGQELYFYKSPRTDRWWMEIPCINKDTGRNIKISCTYNDYIRACNNDLPDRWLKACSRFE